MEIEMERRMLYTPIFHIDTNRINARGKLDAMNCIEKWFADEVILVNISGVSFKEARVGGNLAREQKAAHYNFTLTNLCLDSSNPQYRAIEAALFPGGAKGENQRNDVKIVYEAVHYQAILVTGDGGSRSQPGGMLGNRQKLKDIVRIMSAEEAVHFIEEQIAERDRINREIVENLGGELPEWTGKD
jgi:hypothetical protein